MPFKMVTESEKLASRVAGAALSHAELIAKTQTARWRERLRDGQDVVDAEQVQRFHGQDLQRLRQQLRSSEAAYLDSLRIIREARERRDATVAPVREVLYAVRDLFTGVYGEAGPRALFRDKPAVPADATPLLRVARLVMEKLEDPDLELPEARLNGTRLNLTELAGEVKTPLEALERAMQTLEEVLPMAAKTLADKRRAHAAVDEKNGKLARYLEALYDLEGEEVLADAVRRSSHRPKEPDPEAASEDAEDSAAREGALEITELPDGSAPTSTSSG